MTYYSILSIIFFILAGMSDDDTPPAVLGIIFFIVLGTVTAPWKLGEWIVMPIIICFLIGFYLNKKLNERFEKKYFKQTNR